MQYLNTSNVNVNHDSFENSTEYKRNLNTSNVNVNPVPVLLFCQLTPYLNTSNVNVNPGRWEQVPFYKVEFKYI